MQWMQCQVMLQAISPGTMLWADAYQLSLTCQSVHEVFTSSGPVCQDWLQVAVHGCELAQAPGTAGKCGLRRQQISTE